MNFKKPWWLANRHAQSIIPRLRRTDAPGQWTSIRTRDGDQLQVKTHDTGGPLVLLLHGLGGCAESVYVRGMQQHLNQAGLSTWAWNARGAVTPNQQQQTYHGGCYADVEDLIAAAGAREIFVIGFSLGAAMLVNTLGRGGAQVKAAIAISCPFNFVNNARHLDSNKGAIYRRYLIGRLTKMAARKRDHGRDIQAQWADQYPTDEQLRRLRYFQDFDDQITAPLNGFADAQDLYTQVDPGNVLAQVTTPLLMLQGDDDPFFTADSRPPLPLPKSCQFELTHGGGHVGFVSGSWPWTAQYYAEHRCLEFVLQHCGEIR